MKKLTIAGICAAVVLVLALVVYAEGHGRVKGDCMKDCMAINSDAFDKNSIAVQACHAQCPSAAVDNSQCSATAGDDCCVPFSGDEDCGGIVGTSCLTELTVTYTGAGEVLTNPQNGKASVTGDATGFANPYIAVPSDGELFFSGTVLEGESFTISAANAGADALKATTFVYIYADEAAYNASDDPVQMILIHTSCSETLEDEDQFGSIVIGAPPCTPGWGPETAVAATAAFEGWLSVCGNGNYVVYYKPNEIFLYDKISGQTTQITSDGIVKDALHAQGNKIVWRQAYKNIVSYDISTQQIIPIVTGAINTDFPRTDGNKVIWQEYRDGSWNLYLWDNGVETLIGDVSNADVSGNYIVYLDPQIAEIILYDISAGTTQQLTTTSSPFSVNDPKIDGNKVIWELEESLPFPQDDEIYTVVIYDIISGTTIAQLTDFSHAEISGNMVLMISDVAVKHIHAYDISTGQTTQVTDFEATGDVEGNTAAWEDYRSGSMDVFYKEYGCW